MPPRIEVGGGHRRLGQSWRQARPSLTFIIRINSPWPWPWPWPCPWPWPWRSRSRSCWRPWPWQWPWWLGTNVNVNMRRSQGKEGSGLRLLLWAQCANVKALQVVTGLSVRMWRNFKLSLGSMCECEGTLSLAALIMTLNKRMYYLLLKTDISHQTNICTRRRMSHVSTVRSTYTHACLSSRCTWLFIYTLNKHLHNKNDPCKHSS